MKLLLPALVLAVATAGLAEKPRPMPAPNWVASWATSQQGPEPQNGQNELEAAKLTDATVRQIVHLSLGGSTLRLHLSNAFGTHPLTVDSIHVARAKSPASSAIDPATDRAVTFAGKTSVVIPTGAVYLSDPVALAMPASGDLAISFHYALPPSVQTQHLGSRATSYLTGGQRTAEAELPNAERTVRWLGLAEVDVAAAPDARTVIAFGDSITDGHGATTDGNDRWPDVLARRLQADAKLHDVAVVNEGIGGNHLLTNGLGESALQRFDRDVLAVSGARTLLILEGINDLGGLGRTEAATAEQHAELVAHMEAAFVQMVERAHAHGIRVIGATIMPDGGSTYYHPSAADEAARQAVNTWIREPGHFDNVVDLDKVARDPANPQRLLPAFDSGDHLHPGPAGYKAMGEAFPLGLLY